MSRANTSAERLPGVASQRYCDGMCPAFQTAVEVIAKPWTAQILYVLEEMGRVRYATLKSRLGSISDRMLIDAHPVRVEYCPTEAAFAFGPIARALSKWGTTLLER